MGFDDPHARSVFFEIHSGLEREGPGDRPTTERAFAMVAGLPPSPRVLNPGCGPGAETLHLAELAPSASILACDLHPPFIDVLRQRIAERGLGGRVEARVADMVALDLPEGSCDLVWCEGAIYNVGVEAGLRAWQPLLRPGGSVAFSDAVWLRPEPPARVRKFWEGECPELTDVEGTLRRIERAGYGLTGYFVVDEAAWWAYYEPLEARLVRLRERFAGDAAALSVIAETQHEIELYREASPWFGYAFFVAQSTT